MSTQIKFNDHERSRDLRNDVNPDTLRSIEGYSTALEEVNKYCESNNIPLSQGFGAYVMNEDKSEIIQDKFMSPLIQESSNLSGQQQYGTNSEFTKEGQMIAEKNDIINEDMRIIGDKFKDTWELFSESIVSTGDLAPMMAAKPPIQYLETIKNNGRLVIDHKTTDQYTIRREYERKYVEVDGERKFYPDFTRDPEFMDKFLNHSQPEINIEVKTDEHANNKANLIELSGVENVNKERDVLWPEARITHVTVEVEEDGEKKEVRKAIKESNESVITQHNNSSGRPQFFIPVEVGGVEVGIGGNIDFDDGNVRFSVPDNVVSFEIQGKISGSRINKVSRVGYKKKAMNFTIQERINMALSYDPKSLKDFATIENTDGLMKMTSIILDLSSHIKDHKVFAALEEDRKKLAEADDLLKQLATGYNEKNDYFEKKFHTDPVAGNNYRPGTPVGWRKEMIPDTFDDLMTDMSMRFNAKSGIKNVAYGSPRATRLIPDLDTMISKDKEYAGVDIDYDVFTMSVKNRSIRVVSTQRARNHNELRIIPRSNDKEQETWTFFQHYSELFKDGKIRDIKNVHMPSIAYIDTFDVFGIHKIMANIVLDDEQKLIDEMVPSVD